MVQFAPSYLAVGQGMLGRHLAGLILALFIGGASAGAVFAQPAEVTAALTEASKVLQKGGYAKAIEIIDGVLRGGKVPADLAAKALLMRAEANEKLGRSAFALADYNSAIWMQGLSATDRKRAEAGYARVQKGLGVSTPAADPGGPASTGSTSGAPQNQAWNTNVQQRAPAAEQQSSGGGPAGIGNFFGKLFGSSSSQQRPAPEQAAPPATAAVVTQAPEPPQPPKAAPKKAAAPTVAVSRSAASTTTAATGKPPESGNFAIQLAAVAEEDKAIAETDRIAKKYGADLGGRSPSLMIVPTSDGGTLYKIVAAPFESRGEGQAICELLKTKGASCMVITKK